MMNQKKEAYIAKKMREFSLESFEDCMRCSECKGKCCKNGGCGLMTCDVPDMSVEGIKAMLDTGKYSISCFYADSLRRVIPVMIAREVNSGRVDFSIISKPCALQTETGCSLSKEERPTQGLLYIPIIGECVNLIDGDEVLNDWYPYRDILEQVVVEETGKSSESLFFKAVAEAMDILMIKKKEEMSLAELNAKSFLEGIFPM